MEIISTNGGGQMKNKLKVFVKQNGFLLLLFMCVCIVAAGTIFIATRDLNIAKDSKDKDKDLVILEEIKENGEDTALENVEVSLIEDASINEENAKDNLQKGDNIGLEEISDEDLVTEEELVEINDKDIKEALNEDDIEYVEDEYEEEEEDIEIVTDKPISPILTVEGEIITEYSIDKLVYSNTLDEWRGHTGIDIKAPLGTKVKAPLDGIIKEVTILGYQSDISWYREEEALVVKTEGIKTDYPVVCKLLID